MKKYSPLEKTRLVDAIIADVNNGMKVKDATAKAGVNHFYFSRWEKRHATVKRNRYKKEYTPVEKARLVDSVITDVNNGVKLPEALKKIKLSAASFYQWEKRHATSERRNFTVHEKYPPQEKARLVDAIIADVNKGARLAEALKKMKLSAATFYLWEKRHATVKRNRYKKEHTPAEKTRLVDSVIIDLNNGEKMPEALKKMKLPLSNFYKWEKRHATFERCRSHKNEKYPPQEKARIINAVIKDVNNGMSVKDATAKAGISRSYFSKWAKYHAAHKRKRYKSEYTPVEKARLVDAIIEDINKGVRLAEALKKMKLSGATFYLWEKRHATIKRKRHSHGCPPAERRRLVNAVIKNLNNGVKMSEALKKEKLPSSNFYLWAKKHATIKRVSKNE